MTLYQNIDAMLERGNFSVDFKNLFGEALVTWVNIKPAPYFEDTKKEFFCGKENCIKAPCFHRQHK